MSKECCGTCKWHMQDENFKEDYICCNGYSDYCSDWTDYEHCCDEWEGGELTEEEMEYIKEMGKGGVDNAG